MDFKISISFIVSIYIFIGSFAIKNSTEKLAIMIMRMIDNRYTIMLMIFALLVIFARFNFLFYTNANPRPYFYNKLTIKLEELR